MEKDRKTFFSRGKRVLLIRNDARNPIKMVLMLYNDDFGSKLTFFWRLGKILCLRKISKNERNKKLHLSWRCIYKNQQILQVSWSAMNALQFGTNSGFPAQSALQRQRILEKCWKNKAQRPTMRPQEFWGISSYLSMAIATFGGRYARELFRPWLFAERFCTA